jgi:acetylornithine aminotransferase
MELFNVYQRFNVKLEKAKGVYVYDDQEQSYLDLYGGHGVVSIGHQHPHFVERVKKQLHQLTYYSNSVHFPIQEKLAHKLGEISNCSDYQLFLCNSGAEANENALKLASFHTGKKKVIAFKKSFHGRTSGALNVTNFPNLSAQINKSNFPVSFLDLNDAYMVKEILKKGDVAAIIVEGIQGVGGLNEPTAYFLEKLGELAQEYGALLILDEIQSGYGRTGDFFAHQFSSVKPDLITVAKGMGNGFPIGGVLISPKVQAKKGMLGTTFGGNPLACAAALAVIETIEKENLMDHVKEISEDFKKELKALPGVRKIRGRGLMLAIDFDFPIGNLRQDLLDQFQILTGGSSQAKQLRILPPLSIENYELNQLTQALKKLEYEKVY